MGAYWSGVAANTRDAISEALTAGTPVLMKDNAGGAARCEGDAGVRLRSFSWSGLSAKVGSLAVRSVAAQITRRSLAEPGSQSGPSELGGHRAGARTHRAWTRPNIGPLRSWRTPAGRGNWSVNVSVFRGGRVCGAGSVARPVPIQNVHIPHRCMSPRSAHGRSVDAAITPDLFAQVRRHVSGSCKTVGSAYPVGFYLLAP